MRLQHLLYVTLWCWQAAALRFASAPTPRTVAAAASSATDVIDVEADGAPYDVETDAASAVIDAAKTALIDAIAGTDRGFKRDRAQTDRVKQCVSALAAVAPPPAPLETADWTLLWTDAPDITSLSGGPLGPTLGRIGQEISTAEGTIVNVIEWAPASWLPGDFGDDRVDQRVVTTFVEDPPGRVKLSIKGAGVRPRRVLGRDLPGTPFDFSGLLTLPFGEFDVLYNDGDLRVVKTGQNYYSVNARKDSETAALGGY